MPSKELPDDAADGVAGFFQKILGIFGMADPEAEKKRIVRQIGKDLNHSHYQIGRASCRERV